MEQFAVAHPWVALGIALIIGLLAGSGMMTLLHRKQAGGKSVADLQKEMDDYREQVSGHFATTSDLFKDMTEKYRDVYNHLASGSQDLCEDPMAHARIEFTENESLSHEATTEETVAEADESVPEDVQSESKI